MSVARRLILALSVVAAGYALGPAPALASCAQANPAEQASRAEVIAYGTLTSIRMTFAPAGPVVTFRPERVLKGTLTSSVEVFFGPTHGGAPTSVDYAGAPPEAHTLYLRRAGDSFETDACSGSHAGAPTADEEARLGRESGVAVSDPVAWPVVAAAAVALALGVVAIVLLRRRRAG